MHVSFVSIPVSDQDKALEFYTKKLGFKVIRDMPMGEQRWIELEVTPGGTSIVLFTPDSWKDKIGIPMNMAFTVDNIQETYTDLKKKGVEILGEPKKESWGSYIVIKDLDSNAICVAEEK